MFLNISSNHSAIHNFDTKSAKILLSVCRYSSNFITRFYTKCGYLRNLTVPRVKQSLSLLAEFDDIYDINVDNDI